MGGCRVVEGERHAFGELTQDGPGSLLILCGERGNGGFIIFVSKAHGVFIFCKVVNISFLKRVRHPHCEHLFVLRPFHQLSYFFAWHFHPYFYGYIDGFVRDLQVGAYWHILFMLS